jgi:hypothetical protein
MSAIGTTYPAHIIISQAKSGSSQTKLPTQTKNHIETAQELEAVEAKAPVWISLPDT